MKKVVLLLLMCALVRVASAGLTAPYVRFSTTGPDLYADGTPVIDNEVYALVWIEKGHSFGGFTAAGEMSDTLHNRLIAAAPLAQKGHCPTTVFLLEDDQIGLETKGTFVVYLLDTRVTRQLDDGTIETDLAGVGEQMNFTSLNAYSAIEGGASAASGGTPTAIPDSDDVPPPCVTAIEIRADHVQVTVSGTVPYLQYGVSAGKSPLSLTDKPLVTGLNGTASGDLTLIVPNTAENRFFKVVRQEPVAPQTEGDEK